MCAIAGVFYNNEKVSRAELRAAVSKMNESQIRRGPDDEGIFDSDHVILGNRRLSIIDLSSAGHQPMNLKTRLNNDLWITFNGEIYNFEALKSSLLGSGHLFQTGTDTEVILALYARYGETSFGMLRGMFAFALWDSNKEKLFLVKDHYGIKPLYYWAGENMVVFASTVKALVRSELVPQGKNSKALISFLLFGSVPLPLTTERNISAVPAGHYLVVSKDKPIELTKYYDPLDSFFVKPKEVYFEDMVNAIRDRLEESVKFHLVSDAPLGIFLSGGLDSSALAAMAAALRKEPVTTLSIDFEEKEFSEKFYQELVAQKIRSDHKSVKVTNKDFFDGLPDIWEAMDQPTVDGINTFYIAQAAKKAGIKAVLSGLGSDEIFFGYPSFRKAAFLRRLQGWPILLKSPLSLISFLGDRYSKLTYFEKRDVLSFYLGIRGLFSPRKVAHILGTNLSEVNDFLRDVFVNELQADEDRIKKIDPPSLLSYLEIKFYLQNQLLKDTDFMSMHHSIEVRVPFLDHLLVEYLSGLDTVLKMDKRVNKPMLVEAVRDTLPQEILDRKKMGFTFPFAKWLRQSPKGVILNISIPADLLSEFKSGKLHWSRFWALAVLGLWTR